MTPWGMVDLWMQAKYFIFCINNVVLLSFLNKSSLFKNFCLQFCQSIPWHTRWLMINFAPKTKRKVCIWDIARNLEPNFDKFFVLITWMCFVNGRSCCRIRSCTGSLSRYTYTTVFTVKKRWPLNENIVDCSKWMKLSLEQEVLHEVLTIFRGDIAKRTSLYFSLGVHTEMYGVFKVKNPKKF